MLENGRISCEKCLDIIDMKSTDKVEIILENILNEVNKSYPENKEMK